ncbi:hypothetical protein GON26_01725 [Flavobacterium sp. GA093]|uniref:WD40-like Beta Propeller Repeat n=1 Tax=Flavobacterium hydrocarbonoxydans TaxID=2683249 RepID=A0A6I4NFP4_9FLAO|nr:PD40 domain-containing protein [Flavobacterium hydrocarbonoxydans]MWB93068.1 hypothetical protein [Flavobacterium hydrocarbonoxydans]
MRKIKKQFLLGSCLIFSVSLIAQINTEVTLFAPEIISNGKVFGLTLSPDGNKAYFVNSFGGRKKLQIMQSEKLNGHWQAPIPAFFSDRKFREIDPIVAADGNAILYNSRKSNRHKATDDKDLDIWMVKRNNGKWSKPFPVAEINSDENETYATMAANGNIYFGLRSNKKGYGGNDIYMSRLVEGKYQSPINLGYPINTKNDEGNSFIAADESYIIFSSDCNPSGFGQADLYISFNENGRWSVPLNLGAEINSAQNDFCPIIFNQDTLIFARSEKVGDDLTENIYYARINIPFLTALDKVKPTSVFDKVFPDGDVYGISFSPDGKHAYTTKSAADRSVCEIYQLDIGPDGSFINPKKMDIWQITPNVANPVISTDGTFAMLRISETGKDPDLYISKKDLLGNWQQPVRLPENINTPTDQYYPELTAENGLYYSSSGAVFYAEYKNRQWQNPEPVEGLNTKDFSESNIAVSRDGKWLVFLSNRTGVYGAYDLFLCKKSAECWSEPINLGSKINTNAMEYQPRFSIDNKTLYFTRSVFTDAKRQGRDEVLKVEIGEVLDKL